MNYYLIYKVHCTLSDGTRFTLNFPEDQDLPGALKVVSLSAYRESLAQALGHISGVEHIRLDYEEHEAGK